MFISITVINSNAQSNVSLNIPKDKRVYDAYAYWLGQEYTLSFIKDKFPQFELNAIRAENSFNNSFGKSREGIKKYILKLLGVKNSSELEEKVLDEIKKFTNSKSYSELDILNVIAEIENRAKGGIPSPILETLLSFQFADRPHDEMIYGFTKIFSTKGHPKSKNTSWQIKVPLSWKSEEGERPNIIQKFRSDYGSGDQTIMMIVREMDVPKDYNPSKEELEELFSEHEIKSMLPDANSKYITSVKMKIEGNYGAMMIFEQIAQRLDIKRKTRSASFFFVRDAKLYNLICHVSSNSVEEDLSPEMDKYLPLFKLVANSIVLNDQYIN